MPELKNPSTPADRLLWEKGLPSNIEAEQMVLGVCLANERLLPEVRRLTPSDFVLEKHKRLFSVMISLYDQQKPIEPFTVIDELEFRHWLASCDGVSGVTAITEGMPRLSSVAQYVETLEKYAALRVLKTAGLNLVQDVDDGRPVDEIRGEFMALVEGVTASSPSMAREKSVNQGLDRYIAYARDIATERIRLDFGEFDHATGGLGKGEVLTILARTGVGKTTIVLNMLARLCQIRDDFGGVFFSLEMPELGVIERLIQIHTSKGRREVQHAAKEGFQGIGLMDYFRQIYGDRLHIYDRPCGVLEMERFVRAVRDGGRPVDVIGIDFVQNMKAPERGMDAITRVGENARLVKELAKELGVGVILLSQVKRDGGGKANDGSEKPKMTDAAESTKIETFADYVLGAWRPELGYKDDAEIPDSQADRMGCALLKVRNGPTLEWQMRFDKKSLRLEPISYAEGFGFDD